MAAKRFGYSEDNFMTDFSINEMLDMQKRLQDKYKDQWEKIMMSCYAMGYRRRN